MPSGSEIDGQFRYIFRQFVIYGDDGERRVPASSYGGQQHPARQASAHLHRLQDRDSDGPSGRASIACNAIIASMATLTIRQLDDAVKARLRVRAAEHGKSMEEEAREILRQALAAPPTIESGTDWVSRIRERLKPFGGVDLELPPRQLPRKPPTFRGSGARNRVRAKR
jgi:plasmid stability protein